MATRSKRDREQAKTDKKAEKEEKRQDRRTDEPRLPGDRAPAAEPAAK
jgi:hypothetical protein